MTTPEDVHLMWDEQTSPFVIPFNGWYTHFPVLLQQPITLPQNLLNMLETVSAVNYHKLLRWLPKNPRYHEMDYSAEAFLIIKISVCNNPDLIVCKAVLNCSADQRQHVLIPVCALDDFLVGG